ncbi:MAG TPA: CRISPR-associated endonuclease Cas3'', partial [Chitinispirillaceae bacterium]|nr:CRISPR-associated endonuclease Cas3'' [Chitinispirillaceae bacterium]
MGEEGVEVRGDIPDFLWAKTTKSGNMGKSVLSHLNDVREVAYLLLQNSPMVLSKTGLCAKQIATFSGLHDIGKVSPGFQAKCVEWLEKYRLPPNYGIGYETNHSVVTQFTIKEILQKTGVKTEAAELWATILGAHHSKLHRPGLILRVSDGEWQSLREEIVNEFLNGEKLPDFTIDCLWPFLWWVTGLVTVSDWIGSAEDWFPVMQETLPADSK